MVVRLNSHNARRQSRPSIKSVHELVCALSYGRLLTKTYCRCGPVFTVGDQFVDARVVNEALTNDRLEPRDCGLFVEASPQTWGLKS